MHWKSNAISPPPFRHEVEEFFEPSVSAIVEGVKEITTGADPTSTVRIWLSSGVATPLPPISLFSSPEVLVQAHGYSRKSDVKSPPKGWNYHVPTLKRMLALL